MFGVILELTAHQTLSYFSDLVCPSLRFLFILASRYLDSKNKLLNPFTTWCSRTTVLLLLKHLFFSCVRAAGSLAFCSAATLARMSRQKPEICRMILR